MVLENPWVNTFPFLRVKGVLQWAEFLLYARQFLSDNVATLLTRRKLEFKKRAESKNLIRMLTEMLKKFILTYINYIAAFDWIKCTLWRSHLVQTRYHSLL